jgi:hypothetical protein
MGLPPNPSASFAVDLVPLVARSFKPGPTSDERYEVVAVAMGVVVIMGW